jgi:MoaA/NifB/PqqE/SkfB family radical SAM enzyme
MKKITVNNREYEVKIGKIFIEIKSDGQKHLINIFDFARDNDMKISNWEQYYESYRKRSFSITPQMVKNYILKNI